MVLPGRPWYERYQPVSYLIETRSGTEFEFQMMTARCNAVGVRVYADIVINHMTGDHDRVLGTAFSKGNTTSRDFYGVPYTAADFHTRCSINNWNSAIQVRNCELFGLHDLDQSQPHVRDVIMAYLDHLVDLGVAGFRFDTVRHMWPQDLRYIYSEIKDLRQPDFPPGSRPWIYQEVWHDENTAPGA
jgi:alpha-amylase